VKGSSVSCYRTIFLLAKIIDNCGIHRTDRAGNTEIERRHHSAIYQCFRAAQGAFRGKVTFGDIESASRCEPRRRSVIQHLDDLRDMGKYYSCDGVSSIHADYSPCGVEQIKTLESLRGPDSRRGSLQQICGLSSATRKALLGGIMKWVTEPDGKRTLWLNGVAGSGKSTVANTIAFLFAEMGLLGASFRFSQHIEPKFLFRNLLTSLLCSTLASGSASFEHSKRMER